MDKINSYCVMHDDCRPHRTKITFDLLNNNNLVRFLKVIRNWNSLVTLLPRSEEVRLPFMGTVER